jgi:hypothetical protein
MALVACPDCEQQISSSAAACPNCGRPMFAVTGKVVQTQRRGGKYEGVGFLMIIAGMRLCFANGVLGGITVLLGFIVFLIGRFM